MSCLIITVAVDASVNSRALATPLFCYSVIYGGVVHVKRRVLIGSPGARKGGGKM